MPIIIISIVYAMGYALCFCMLRIEQEADQEMYTKGDRAACIVLSLLSFVAVLGLLIAAWVRMVKETGYWERPIKPVDDGRKPGGYQTDQIGSQKHVPVNMEDDDE